MVFYIEQGSTTLHLVRKHHIAICKLYSPNWRLPQEPYSLESMCDTCLAELVIWQLAELPAPWYIWFNPKKGQLTHEQMG